MTYTEEEYNEVIRAFSAQIVEKDSVIASLTSERDELKMTISNFLASDEARRAELIANAVKSETQKRIDELDAKISKSKAELLMDEQELASLKAQT